MRIHRLPLAVARFLFVVVIGTLATALGTVVALTQTEAGHAVVARVLSDRSPSLVRGSIQVARVGGNFRRNLTLDSVIVRDSAGGLLALLPRVEVTYHLRNLLRGRILLDRLVLDQPRILLVKHRGGRMNYEEVLRLGEGKPGGPAGPLVELRNVEIRDGILTIRTPWNPPGELRTDAQRDSALRAQRRQAGKRIESGPDREGLQQVRTVEGLALRFPRLRIATPDRAPILIVVDSLAATLNDPLVRVADLAGELRTAHDTLWFDLRRAAMPGTRGKASGLVAWPEDTLLYNFEFEAPEVALADLRFVSPQFPDYTGRGTVQAFSFDGTLSQFEVTGLAVGDSASAVSGQLTALIHRRRGLGFRGLDLALRNVDLEVPRPYLDTLPFRGRLSGRLQADGYFDDLRVGLDWTFFDDRIGGRPENRLALQGRVTLGGPEGMVFHDAEVTAADLDLPTTRLAAPTVILEGRATGAGRLDGPWKDVTFTGRLRHQDGELPHTVAEGRIRLNTRDTMVGLDADLDLLPLAFDGIRPAFPTLTARGAVRGSVRLRGRLDSMELEADLEGGLGRVHAEGLTTLLPPRWGAAPLALTFTDLDVAEVLGRGPPTRLDGTMVLDGVIDSLAAPEGSVAVTLGPGWIREVHLDTLVTRLTVRDSTLTVDSSVVTWAGGSATAAGALGWLRPHDGRLTVHLAAGSLRPFDSLATVMLGLAPDTVGVRPRLEGTAEAHAVLSGALDSLDLTVEGQGRDFRWAGLNVTSATGRLGWRAGARPALDLSVVVDTVTTAKLGYHDLRLEARGPADSVSWSFRGRDRRMARVTGGGVLQRDSVARFGVDSLTLGLRENRWRLLRPFAMELGDSVIAFTPLRLEREDGAARINLDGSLPNRGSGELDVVVDGFDLRDAAAFLQRDTATMRGLLQLDLHVTGTAAEPTLRGAGAMTGAVFGDFRAPLARTALYYTDRRLLTGSTLWRTGSPVMEIAASLPLDLAWRRPSGAGRRQLPGELSIRASTDSFNLAILEAFTPNLRRVSGTMTADVLVRGSWDEPRLGGKIRIHEGRAAVPPLGVAYGPINGGVALSGDSILVDSLTIEGRRGTLDLGGSIRLDRLTTPILDLTARARGFTVMDVAGYLTLELDANALLTGPVLHPVLTGSGTARNSVLYFSDLVTKAIVNLEDPLYSDLVDTTALRQRGLGAAFQSRFLDSLTIRDLRFRAAEGVWLRSNEANIQLEGAASVNKTGRIYRLEGTFNATRGSYNLKVGPITKAFDVTRGVVRYLGDADLNADLDVEARHVIKSATAEGNARDLEVIAKIGGTLLVPKLTLESTIRPPLSQSDLVSLLVLGQTVNSTVANQSQNQRWAQAMALLAGSLTSELERSLVSDSKAGPDMIEIRPGIAYGSVAEGSSLTRLSAGWQLGPRWFVSLNAGFCPGFQQFDFRNFGASLDYQLRRFSVIQVSAEPVQTCLSGAAGGTTTKRYQFGSDIRWRREY
jgi:hypothetical protein